MLRSETQGAIEGAEHRQAEIYNQPQGSSELGATDGLTVARQTTKPCKPEGSAMRLHPFAALFPGAVRPGPRPRAPTAHRRETFVATEDFDFYVLTLSWSPGFCDTGGAASWKTQCAVGSGEGFVVHGLWPDNAYKADPADCGSSGAISNDALQQTLGLYPRPGLARYE